MKKSNGFTLVEIMLVLVIAIMLIGGVFVIYLMSIRSWKEGTSNVALERNAGIIMEKIVRGIGGRFGLREADIGTVQISEDGRSVTYMVDKNDPPTPWNSDDVTSRYYQLGTQVWYDPNTSIAGNEIALNRFGDVDQANFSVSDYVLTAKLVLSSEAPRTTARRLSVEMQTDIFFRKKK